MKTAGIIVEYNPFHNGHQLHIERTRKETDADFIIAVMSGNFVQRGIPAVTDKHMRTKMALLGGADLVLELPVMFSAGSAGDFAAGAVSLLDKLGVVDTLCFGSEAGSIAPFQSAASLLSEEPPEFSQSLQENLRLGRSFPLARSIALQNCLSSRQASVRYATEDFSGKTGCAADTCSPLPDNFLTTPNNILGVEYCTALYKRKSAICPVTLKREGAGYHDDTLFSEKGSGHILSSATAIRRILKETQTHPDLNAIAPALPASQLSCWQEILSQRRLLFPEDFTKELRCRLILDASDGFSQYADVSRELSDKLKKNHLTFTDWDSLCEALKTRELTYSRISRALCRILLSITDCQLQEARAKDYVPYARILGFKRSAEPLLSAIKQNSSIPLISKLADAYRLLPADAFTMLQQDITAAHLYESAVAAKNGTLPQNEYTRQLCII